MKATTRNRWLDRMAAGVAVLLLCATLAGIAASCGGDDLDFSGEIVIIPPTPEPTEEPTPTDEGL